MKRIKILYGLDPEKPYVISFITDADITFQEDEIGATDLNGMLEAGRTAGSFDWNSYTQSEICGMLALALGRTLGTGASTYSVKVELAVNPAGENISWLPLFTYGYSFGPFTDSPVYNLIPNSVVGIQGTTEAAGATRSYKWGLFSNALAAALPNRSALNAADWLALTAIPISNYYHMAFLIKGGDMKAISSYNQTDTEFTDVFIQMTSRYGTRRS